MWRRWCAACGGAQAGGEKPTLTRLVGQVDRFQVEVFCKAAQKQGQGGRMNLFKKASSTKSSTYTVEDMLTFSKVPTTHTPPPRSTRALLEG